jgi:hypothetical protein
VRLAGSTASFEPMRTRQKWSLFAAAMGLVLGLASIASVVPRIRLVEAVTLFASAFGAGAGLTEAIRSARTDPARRHLP